AWVRLTAPKRLRIGRYDPATVTRRATRGYARVCGYLEALKAAVAMTVDLAVSETPELIYTHDQLEAIHCIEGNLQIIACAGSGKTQVIAERISYILETKWSGGVRPRNFIAFTFTDRAAAALKDRIAKRIRARLGPVPGLAEMYVGTIHGFCLELLQRRVPEYFKYQVLTEIQTKLLVD